MTLAKANDYEKIGTNLYRKGSICVSALATTVLGVFVTNYVATGTSTNYIEGIPDIAISVFASIVAIIGIIVFVYQIISVFTNKIIFSPYGIEINRFRKKINIPTQDVIRIDGIRERVLGTPTENRSVFTIITNTKTYEVDSHEFWGLRKAVLHWVQTNTEKKERDDEN